MTISTATGTQSALSGLEAYQAGIDTTSDNISNADTAGYTRETVDKTESTPLDTNTGKTVQVGTGVTIQDITRVRDQYLDQDYRTQNASSSYYSTLSTQLSDVETGLDDSSTTGISTALANLWSAFNSMGQDDTATSQTAVASAASALISEMQSVSGQIGQTQDEAESELTDLTSSNGVVQQDAYQIASLNSEISRASKQGVSVNTLLDQRDELLDELSGYANTTVISNTANAGVTVVFAGVTLIDSSNTVRSVASITYSATSGGELGALANLASTSPTGALGSLASDLDTVGQALVSQFSGTSLGGLFTFSGGGQTVEDLTFNTSMLSTIGAGGAAAAAAYSGATADQDYATFVDEVGTAAQSASNASTTATALSSAVESQRESVSGVSLDEEMENLVTYQQGYEACAKAMSALDTVIQSLLDTVQ